MKIRNFIKTKLINLVKKHTKDLTEERLEIITYGIELFLVNIFKVIMLILIAILTNTFNYFLIAFVSINFLRIFAGGVHAKSSVACFLMSLLIFFTPIYIAFHIQFSLLIKIIILMISLILLMKYAPADLEEKPYVNPRHRKVLNRLSVISSILLFVISYFIKDPIYSNIIILSLIIVPLLTTPLAYQLLKRRYRNYEYYNSD